MQIIVGAVLVLAAAISSSIATDYCDNSMCKYSSYKTHIACGYNGKFSPNCQDAVVPNIDDKLKKLILAEFNKKRNFIAGGGNPNLSPACSMGTMQWDDELAQLATMNVKRCKFDHDCHATKKYPLSGQNIYEGSAKDDISTTFTNAINLWYAEHKDTSKAAIRQYPESVPTNKVIGHFFAMMNKNNDRVGCAAVVHTLAGNSRQDYLACNFATGHAPLTSAYYECDTPATRCAKGPNKEFPNLCSTSEIFTYTDFNRPNKKS